MSVSIAMYSLVTFYENMKDYLKPHRPLTKFLAIKFVIFFSFWQSVVVAGFVKIGVIHSTTYWTADNVGSGIQNTLVCIEMVVAGLLHIYAFDYKDFMIKGTNTPLWNSFLRVIYLVDVAKDTQAHLVPKKVTLLISRKTQSAPANLDKMGEEKETNIELIDTSQDRTWSISKTNSSVEMRQSDV